MSNRKALWINPVQDPEEDIYPCIVVENEPGYYRSDWNWGRDMEIARHCAREKNESMGLTAEDVEQIIHSSMWAGVPA